MSLAHLVSITDQEAVFRSHIDGSLVRFSPEDSIRVQAALGADIIMCLDHLTGWPVSRGDAREAMERTLLWARRAKKVEIGTHQSLFGIVQGSIYPELRRHCALIRRPWLRCRIGRREQAAILRYVTIRASFSPPQTQVSMR